ncbi:LytTR family transcriptional regulator DNA-binding domain-containing protein [Spirosoma validum]|uniref:LytTR family transcriptional regulator DNA-binding domain-containing protein n=1 Tax=Spirosoma validum TaxID=2771355 RepID=A0A927GF11_9BACT|nr:LytTR family transcriptional regulator DNA-binding domain-containing protein [Spirosoma validum]MBD2755243.1 LytTR family transcriptional regulator DNA-binding domain-containing protein [Spirosoma validum]
MLRSLNTFLNRPIAEDFSFKNQVWQSLQSGLYVFLFVYFFGGSSFTGNFKVLMLAIFGVGCAVATLIANWVVPLLLPTIYNEDHWTVWKQILHTLFILFCISTVNQLLLISMHYGYPPFWQMYVTVTLIGFFPISLNVFVVEQRRLKRTLAQAQTMNEQLAHRVEPTLIAPVSVQTTTVNPEIPVASKSIVLMSESGKERLSLQPDQLLYVESVGNYVDVHWLNADQLQKTVLRNTLKDVADALATYPQFFRCHRAFLVNLQAINQTEGNARGYQLTLKGNAEKIPVSRSYLDAFDERINAVL